MKLKIEDLLSLEDYDDQREVIKKDLISHKKNRTVSIGEHVILLFEDYSTIKYKVQEMLRIEKIFEAELIQDELDTYNPLIPDGNNLKATMLIEYTDILERKEKLQKLKGVEKNIWIKIGNSEPVYPIADEDLEREDETKTSAVHFLRWEFDKNQIKDFKEGSPVSIGVNHREYESSCILH